MRLLFAASALLTLAVAVGLSLVSGTAEAAFPGVNGKLVCEASRRPSLVIPSPNPTAISRSEILSINPDGTGETLLTNNVTRDGDASFSPDGKKIAFEGRRVMGQPDNSEIYVANNDGDLEGPDVKRLTFNNGELTGRPRSQVAATDRSPSWSPDGTQIVFHSGREATFNDGGTTPTNDFEIYSMNAQTGELGGIQRLTNQRGQDAIPHWSPSGSKIVFQSLRDTSGGRSQNLEVYTINPDGSNPTNVSNSSGTPDNPATASVNENANGQDSAPQFSPDGNQIVFTSSRSSTVAGNANYEIFKMNADGTGQTRLTANLSGDTPSPAPFADFDNTASWSPDGQRIVFTSGRTSVPGDDDFVAYTMSSVGGEAAGGVQRLAETDVTFAKCDWQAVRATVTPPPPPGRYYPPPFTLPSFFGCPASSTNVIAGTAGNNNLTGTARGDRIFAGPGNDTADGLAGDDCVDLGPGVDRGQGGTGNDVLLGGLGADRVSGSAGNDLISGNPDNDRLDGGSGNDRVSGDAGNDTAAGAAGSDRVNGGTGKDKLSGGSSADRLAGDQGNDNVAGNSGNDKLAGNAGSDRINGGSGRDSISGGAGNDRISARDRKRDTINCGSGRDSVTADRIDRVSRNCERVRRR